ncbi:hypothetical protein PVAP13_8KG017101 [Panicum virgatum]|uniref:Uncharacterized protein n=1 Tax=Panicum virgatum TaxID=38727 RepID=A0A8T0PF36_PANVG|nr:hypothetical protein PVAP13_8KG017101 [Panicum virgatum]
MCAVLLPSGTLGKSQPRQKRKRFTPLPSSLPLPAPICSHPHPCCRRNPNAKEIFRQTKGETQLIYHFQDKLFYSMLRQSLILARIIML